MNGPTFAQPTTAAAPPRAVPPRPVKPAKAAPKPDMDSGNGLKVLTYLRLHWLLILFCGTLVGGVGAYVAWDMMASKFESTSLLQVSSVPLTLGSQSANQPRTEFSTYVKTAAQLLKSDYVMNAALRDIKDLPTIKLQKEPIKFLDEEVLVNWSDGSEVVRVTFKGHNPNDVKRIVDSVQRAFMTEVVQKDVQDKQLLMRKVEEAKQGLEKILQDKAKRPEMAKGGTPGVFGLDGVPPGQPEGVQPANLNNPPGPLPAPLGPKGPDDPGAPAMTLPPSGFDPLLKFDPKALVGKFARLQEECERLPIDIQIIRIRMKEIEGKVDALKKAPVDSLAIAAADKDPEVAHQARLVRQAEFAYQFAKGSGNANAPGVRDRKQIFEAEEAKLKTMREEKARDIETVKRKDDARKLYEAWEANKAQLERLEAQHTLARTNLKKVEKQLFDLPAPTEKVSLTGRVDREKFYEPGTTDLMTLDQIYSRLVAQHQMLKYELEAPPRVKLLQPASNPMQKDMKKQIVGTVAAGLMGYMVIALGVVAFEMVSRRVSSLTDVKTAAPTPVVGVIPCQPNEGTGRDPVKRAAANEAVDKLRAYVSQAWLSRGATCVAVTSPLGDEGKAFTSFGLASSLAQAGYKTLLIDFDLREPAIHTYAGAPNQVGVCEILRGEVESRSAVLTLPNGLDMLPAGKWSDEARKAAVGGRLEALLARLKEPYDCVILHAHALLTVAESVEVARRCEVVLVCAQFRETKLPLLSKATDRLAAMEVPYTGLVYVGATEHEALC